jgi:ubiquinone/menaquinone biosynthesis C-methylase UbiE
MTPADREAQRILDEYARRERELAPDEYSLAKPANLFARQGQERALLEALRRAELLPLGERRILEVGCGRGRWLATFEQFGARRDRLAGIDLDEARLAESREKFAGADLRAGDATKLPWSDGSFDVVFQSLVFTSILDGDVRAAVAREMRRVLTPSGVILWYDFSYNNPANPNVRGVGRAEVSRLFPDCTIELRRVTLAPPLARRLVQMSWLAASVLERMRVLNTHYFGVLRPR